MLNRILFVFLLIIWSVFAFSADDSYLLGNPKRAEWMVGKFGLMNHYLFVPPGETEEEKTENLNKIVDNFDIDYYMDQVEQIGASWLFFTVGQNTKYYCSPNSVIEKCYPGHTSKRDLMLELATECHKRGLRFVFYIPADSRWMDDGSGYYNTWTAVCREYSQRLGKLCDGWWVDGCDPKEMQGEFGKMLAEAMRSGNHDTCLGISCQTFAAGSYNKELYACPYTDYMPGEVHLVEDGYIRTDGMFDSSLLYQNEEGYVRVKNNYPKFFEPKEQFILGQQLHALVPTDSCFQPFIKLEWVNFDNNKYVELAHSFTDAKGGITFNCAIDKSNGHIPEEAFRRVKKIGDSYKGDNANKKYPLDKNVLKRSKRKISKNPNPKNIAYCKPSDLMNPNLDIEISSSGFIYDAYLGNDGDYETWSVGGDGFYAYAYKLDLEEITKVKKVSLYFGNPNNKDKGFADEFLIKISDNGKDWKELEHNNLHRY